MHASTKQHDTQSPFKACKCRRVGVWDFRGLGSGVFCGPCALHACVRVPAAMPRYVPPVDLLQRDRLAAVWALFVGLDRVGQAAQAEDVPAGTHGSTTRHGVGGCRNTTIRDTCATVRLHASATAAPTSTPALPSPPEYGGNHTLHSFGNPFSMSSMGLYIYQYLARIYPNCPPSIKRSYHNTDKTISEVITPS